MKGISTVVHMLSEIIRDLITIGLISKESYVLFRQGNFKAFKADYSVSVMQYEDFADYRFSTISDIIEDAFVDTDYKVRVFREAKCHNEKGILYCFGIAVDRKNK